MFSKIVREVCDDGTEQNETFETPENDEKKIIKSNYLAGFSRKTASEKMEKPGDFYYATPHKDSLWSNPYIMINCPYCGIAFALPKPKIINQRGEPLTIEQEIRCAYNPAHYFKINEGKVIPMGNLK